MPTIKIADKPTLDAAKTVIDGVSDTLGSVADEVRELWERTPFDIDSYMYYFGGLRSTHPGDDVYNYLMRAVTIVDAPGVKELGEYALYKCTNLTSLSLPDCTVIRQYALGQCTMISTFNAPKLETVEGNRAITVGNFRRLILPSFTTPTSTEFYSGSGTQSLLEYIYFGKIAIASTMMFAGTFPYIKYVMFGDALTTISAVSTPNANNLILLSTVAVSLTNASFVTGYKNVYVPASVYDGYIVATNWSSVADKIHKIEDSQEILDAIAEMGVEYQ